jgi:hypothetical protein
MNSVADIIDKLDSIYALCTQGKNQAAAEETLSCLELELRNGHYNTVDEFLRLADVTRLTTEAVYAIIVITSHEPDKFKERPAFALMAEAYIESKIGERINNLAAFHIKVKK